MSQHGRFEQDYLRMKVQIDKLKASGLSEEQRTMPFMSQARTVRPFMSMIPTPSSAVSRKRRLLVKMFTRSIVKRNFTPMVSFPPF